MGTFILNLFEDFFYHSFSILSDNCPTDWIDGGENGCFFIDPNSPKLTEPEALNYCQSKDSRAHLAEIRNSEIQSFIQNRDEISGKFWWIGATDEENVHALVLII